MANSSSDQHIHLSPADRFWRMLVSDRSDLIVLMTYTVITGLLSLAVPLAAQALVNTIAAGIFLQPLIVLSILVFVGLLFGALLRMLKFCLVERLQQRIFAFFSLDISERIPEIKASALVGEYMPELVNRFFDVITVQKSWAKLLLEVPSAILQVFVGLVLMAFYSPLLLAFDVIIILFIVFSTAVLGYGGLRTSIRESLLKYKVAEWLEDMGRCQTGFKISGVLRFLTEHTDGLVVNYLNARRAHFSVLYRQAVSTYVFQALASTGVLAIGGWLVINRQLTLGQLVAAELIVLTVLSALEKIIRSCDVFYDLLTGLDKVGHITDLPVERRGGIDMPEQEGGMSVACYDVRFSYGGERSEVLSGLNLGIASGEKASLVGASGAGKTTLAWLLCGIYEPSHGTVELGGFDLRDVSLPSFRRRVGLVGDANEVFEGTIEDNITLGRPYVSHQDVRWALDIAQFSKDLVNMPSGLSTMLVSGGRNLSRGQVQRLLIARALAGRPDLLILDEAFTGIDEATKLKIVEAIFAPENSWTIFDISHDAEVVMRSSRVYVLSAGKIVESGTPADLSWRNVSEFSTLFPDLAAQIRSVERRKTDRSAKV
ncbi:MAG: ATP-binding cassette domain-containing protein [Candidatus Melainabacteria bacterium]|jgi:ATP-binding cassette subfamily B protein|nr:ATP-binding cassette domain-containing protein [Candidatus Melainabacteria bacterium]